MKPIVLEAVVSFMRHFHLTGFRVVKIYCTLFSSGHFSAAPVNAVGPSDHFCYFDVLYVFAPFCGVNVLPSAWAVFFHF